MKKQLIAFYRGRGWVVRKAPVFVKQFLWWKHIWLGTWFSDELLFISPKGKTLNEQGAWDRLKKKLQKRLAKMEQPTEMEFELLEIAG